jgi:WD40 repeat protein
MTHATSITAAHRASEVTFTPDGKKVAILSSAALTLDTLELFETETGNAVWKRRRLTSMDDVGTEPRPVRTTFCEDAGRLSLALSKEKLAILDATSGRVVMHRRIPAVVQGCQTHTCISPDGTRLGTARGRYLRVFDAVSGDKTLSLRTGAEDCKRLLFAPDGRGIATLGPDGRVHVWDAKSGRLLHTVQAPASTDSMVFGGCSHVLVTAGRHWVLQIWDVTSGRLSRQFDEVPPWSDKLIFGDRGRIALMASTDGTVRLWDVLYGQELSRLSIPDGHEAVAVNRDGTKLATVHHAKSVDIWSISAAPGAGTTDSWPAGSCGRCGWG